MVDEVRLQSYSEDEEGYAPIPDVETLYGDEDQVYWFEEDLPALISERARSKDGVQASGESWFSRLSAVATAVLIHFLHVHYGFNDHNAKRTHLNKQTLCNIIMRVPTEPRKMPAKPEDWPPFPLHPATKSLAQWVAVFQQIPDPPKPPRSYKDDDLSIPAQVYRIESGDSAVLASNDLETAAAKGEKRAEMQQSRLVVHLEAGADPDLPRIPITAHELSNAWSFPPAQLKPQVVSEFSAYFANTNIYGKVALMEKLLGQEIFRMRCLGDNIRDNITFLEARKQELRKRLDLYEAANKNMTDLYDNWDGLDQEVSIMEEKCVAFDKDPVYRAYGQGTIPSRRSSYSPYPSPSIQ